MVVTLKKLMAGIAADPNFAARAQERPPEPEADPRTTAETNGLFQFIGSYVVLFQDIEAKTLDEIIVLAIGHDRTHVGDGVVSFLSLSQKIDLISVIVRSSAIADSDPFRAAWLTSFDDVIQRLKIETTRRNKIVHSMYILNFISIGQPPIRSKRKRHKATVAIDQEDIDAEFMSRALSELTALSFDLRMSLVQLRQWKDILNSPAADIGN